MKKFYALLAAATLGFTAANAQEIEGNRGVLTDSDFNTLSTFVMQCEDGVYRIENMLGHSSGWDGDIYYYDNVFEMTISGTTVTFDPAAPKGFYESYDTSTGTVIGLFLQNHGYYYSAGNGDDYNRAIWLSYYTTNYSTGESEYKDGYIFWNEVEATVEKSWRCDFAFGQGNYDGSSTLNYMSDGTYQLLNAFGTGSDSQVINFKINANNQMEIINPTFDYVNWYGFDYNLEQVYSWPYVYYAYDHAYSYAYVTDDYVYIYYYCNVYDFNADAYTQADYVFITFPRVDPIVKQTWECGANWNWDYYGSYLGHRTINRLSDGTFQVPDIFGENTATLTFKLPYYAAAYSNYWGTMTFLDLPEVNGVKYIEYGDGNIEYIYNGYADIYDDSVYFYIYVEGDAGNGYLVLYYPLIPMQNTEETYEGRTVHKFARVAFRPLVPYQMGETPSVEDVYWDCTLETWEDAPYQYKVYNAFGTGLDSDVITFSICDTQDLDAETAADLYGEPYLTQIGNFTFGDEYVTYNKALKKKKVAFGDNIIWVSDAEVADGERSSYRNYERGELMTGQRIIFRFENQKGGVVVPGCPSANTGELIITWGESTMPEPAPQLVKTVDVMVRLNDNVASDRILTMEIYDNGTCIVPDIFGADYADDDLVFQITENGDLDILSYSYMENGYKYWNIFDIESGDELTQKLQFEMYQEVARDFDGFTTNAYAYFKTTSFGWVDMYWNTDQDTSGISSINAAEGEAVYYNLSGVRVDNPTSGIYIVKQGSKVTKEVVR